MTWKYLTQKIMAHTINDLSATMWAALQSKGSWILILIHIHWNTCIQEMMISNSPTECVHLNFGNWLIHGNNKSDLALGSTKKRFVDAKTFSTTKEINPSSSTLWVSLVFGGENLPKRKMKNWKWKNKVIFGISIAEIWKRWIEEITRFLHLVPTCS